MDIPNCHCGRESHYQNYFNGVLTWTCGKLGCNRDQGIETRTTTVCTHPGYDFNKHGRCCHYCRKVITDFGD